MDGRPRPFHRLVKKVFSWIATFRRPASSRRATVFITAAIPPEDSPFFVKKKARHVVAKTRPLPPELLDAIFSFVERKQDLTSISLASATFHALVRRHLYRVMRLRHPITFIKTWHLLVRRPHLARYVHSLEFLPSAFHISVGLQSRDDMERRLPIALAPGLTRLFFRVLQSMTRLQRLGLPIQSRIWGHTHTNLAKCSFQLRYLELDGPAAVEDLVIFKGHPLLTELSLPHIRFDSISLEALGRLPFTHLPNVSRLHIRWHHAADLSGPAYFGAFERPSILPYDRPVSHRSGNSAGYLEASPSPN